MAQKKPKTNSKKKIEVILGQVLSISNQLLIIRLLQSLI